MKKLALVLGIALAMSATALAAAPDVGGTWSGTFVVTTADGKTKNDTALVTLEQRDSELTGTAGANESQRWAIRKGTIAGDKITFEVSADGLVLRFALALVDGHLRGEATGKPGSNVPRAAVDLHRAPPFGAELTRTVESLDSAVFDAYNRCDMDKFAAYFTEDVEFYHDKSGVSYGRDVLVRDVRQYICGKVRRELLPGSLEVYPIADFGAVEIGSHRFYETTGPTPNVPVGVAKFIHVWQYKDGAWKISRVLSFDHAPAPKEAAPAPK